MKKISLLVRIYKSGEWIENRLNNLLEAIKMLDAEIICINADSPDSRDDLIPSSMVSDKLKYVKLPSLVGVYDAWNIAIEMSESEYLTNANTDDLASPDLYCVLRDMLDADKSIGVAYTSWYSIGMEVKIWSDINSHSVVNPGHFNGDFINGHVGHFPMWRRSLHDK